MKKLHSFLSLVSALMMLCLVACSDEEKAYVTLSVETLEAESDAGEYTFNIESNCDWAISSDADWISIQEPSGTGSATITFSVIRNTNYDEREAVIQVTSLDGSASDEISVIQKEKLGIDKGETTTYMEIPAEGGNFTINIQSNTECEVTQMPDWISHAGTRSLQPYDINLLAEENNSGETRTGTIVIKGGDDKLTFNVAQPSIEILAEAITFEQGNEMIFVGNYGGTLVPVFYPENCTNRELVWSSSNPEVMTVDQNGTLSVVNNGTTVVTALNEASGKSAATTITVKIRANDMALQDEYGNLMLNSTIYCNSRTKFRLYTSPSNAYKDEVSYSSENPDLVSISDGYIVGGAKTGSTTIHIIDNYTGNTYSTNITVSRVTLWAGFKNMTQTNSGFIYILGGGIRCGSGNTIEVLSAWVTDATGVVIASVDQISQPSNEVTFQTGALNFTDLFGITSIGTNMPYLRFVVAYRLNGNSEIYQDFVDINLGTQVR